MVSGFDRDRDGIEYRAGAWFMVRNAHGETGITPDVQRRPIVPFAEVLARTAISCFLMSDCMFRQAEAPGWVGNTSGRPKNDLVMRRRRI